MACRIIIILFFIFLNSISVYGTDNNTELEKWKRIGKTFGCKDGNETIPVNWQNRNPVRGACISPEYDMNQSPNPEDVTIVYFSFGNPKILKVDETEKTFTVEFKQSFFWEDARIKTSLRPGKQYPRLFPDLDTLPSIWKPMFAFTIERMKSSESVFDPFLFSELIFIPQSTNTTFLHLITGGRVNVYCDYEFQNFPFDTQRCKYRLTSRNPTHVQGVLYNLTSTHNIPKQNESVGFSVMIQFRNDSTELGFDVELKRLIQSYVGQYYFPAFAIVAVSFVSFIVPLSSIPGRVALVVTQFLTLTNIFIHQIVSCSTVTSVRNVSKIVWQ